MWNYRLVEEEDEFGNIIVSISEVYYDDNGNPNSFVPDVGVRGEFVEEVLEQYELMEEAFIKPVIRYRLVGGRHEFTEII